MYLRILVCMDTSLIILFFIPLNLFVLFSSLPMSGTNYLSEPKNASFSDIILHIKNISVMILLPNVFALPDMYHLLKMFLTINLLTFKAYISSTPSVQRLSPIMFLPTHLLQLLLSHRHLYHSLSLPLVCECSSY